MRLAGLFVYPVKSLAGVAVDAWPLDAPGLRHDRRFMVVRPDGSFLTQRELPVMATVRTRLVDLDTTPRLELSRAGDAALRVPLVPEGGAELTTAVWGHPIAARHVDAAADRWLSDALGTPAQLVFVPDEAARPVDPTRAPGAVTGFADGFPLLLTGTASLMDLNARLAEPVFMDRFRPNLVVEGAAPYAEDGWRDVRIGAAAIRVVKPCGRCAIVCIDQASGARTAEPLRTLASYRRVGKDACFGQNAIPVELGVLRIGDAVIPA